MSEEEKQTTEVPKEEKPSFSFQVSAAVKKTDEDDDDEGENEVVKEEESTATFVPVVRCSYTYLFLLGIFIQENGVEYAYLQIRTLV